MNNHIKQFALPLFILALLSPFGTTKTNAHKILSLKWVKCHSWSLTSNFLREVIDLFGTTVFVESGTYMGGTTARAASLFQNVHSIELSPQLYQAAKKRFETKKNVTVHLGDSSKILPKILSTINGKILFWLDGHYSMGATAKGKKNTPIVEELEAIKKSGIKDSIIFIDDLRCFSPVENTPKNTARTGYPTAGELKRLVLEISEDYRFEVFGDIAVAFPKSSGVAPSQVMQACTTSRLAQDENTDSELLIQSEKIISQARAEEKKAIKKMYDSFFSDTACKQGDHYHLWYALVLAQEGYIEQARGILTKAKELGLSCPRISYYLELLG